MATISATSVRFGSSLKLSSRTGQVTGRSITSVVSVGWAKNGFPSLRSSSFRVSCAVFADHFQLFISILLLFLHTFFKLTYQVPKAKPETVQKVCEIVRKQLVLSPETELTPESKFSALGADSLDTVEIVMGLEEEFDISVEEDNSQNITTVQEAADLIESIIQKKGEA
ncbi:hypothetical protein C5167_022271 [Papaver somniferum]|uniref:Acyl carrier protein n=1 Tax=Papaver somniferum TaxID=3469 RepID=A0A4Y7JKH0_PAPSO|nr:hypothetical protein C5167_022271 [Papaver somniferum]